VTKPPEGRYSNVSRRVWGDGKFRALSAPKANAQTLWFRLLTGPELGNVPGLFSAYQGGLAQALGWSDAAFRRCWQEIADAEMAFADWSVGLVWVPKSLDHNPPHSTNVVLSWKASLKELPESNLKAQAMASIGARVEAMGEAWAKAWAKACGKECLIQEQEQDQEQEIPPESPPRVAARKVPRKSGRRRPKVPLPEGWNPNDAHRAKAAKLGVDVEAEAEKFRTNAHGKDVRWVDWDLAFHNWLANAATFAPRGPGSPARGMTEHDRAQAERDAALLAEIRSGVWGDQAKGIAAERDIDLRKFRQAIADGKVKRVNGRTAVAIHRNGEATPPDLPAGAVSALALSATRGVPQ
jgi:hypothetical protein